MDKKKSLRLGTRGSKLALWQTEHAAKLLKNVSPELIIEQKIIATRGDQIMDQALPLIGGKGLFTAELERALRDHEIDLAIHSLKDLPTEPMDEFVIAAILERENPADALVSREGFTLETLPQGATVGTSSRRRAAQLLRYRPDLKIIDIRGNVDTRIRKAYDREGPYDAIVLAYAGVARINALRQISQIIPIEVMLPAPGQGALAAQSRRGERSAVLAQINHLHTQIAVTAERAFLAELQAGCSVPVAAYAAIEDNQLRLRGRVLATDGSKAIEVSETIILDRNDDRALAQAFQLGTALARQAIAKGANQLLRPLQDKKILITRAPHQAEELATQLRELGAEPLFYPTIQIVIPEEQDAIIEALRNIKRYDWLTLTSQNTVRAIREILDTYQIALPENLPIAAVGRNTAEACRELLKIEPQIIAEQYTAQSLAKALKAENGRRILSPQSAIARTELAEELRASGAIVETIPVYQTIVGSGGIELRAAIRNNAIDALTFTSPSTIRNLLIRYEAEGGNSGDLKILPAFCIGPVTAEAATEREFQTVITPETYTLSAMIASIKSYFERHP